MSVEEAYIAEEAILAYMTDDDYVDRDKALGLVSELLEANGVS